MKTITKIADIDYSTQESISFDATVLDVVNEGLEENKRPIRVSLKLEDSGETIQAISWSYNLLQLFKDGAKSADIILFEAMSGTFSNKQQQIRIGNAKPTGKQSLKKIVKAAVDTLALKREYQSILNKYVSTPLIREMLDKLIMDDSRFFEWPAATKVHHNFEGGLAVHTLQVIKHTISFWEAYKGENLDLETMVAGAMLHDIGKLSEYQADGSRTILGDLISHIVDGSERVSQFCWSKGINPLTDKKMVIIKHIILSHHEKLEYGAAVQPAVLEAILVARADALDATFEGINRELLNLTSGQQTEKLLSADGVKILRWQ